MWQCEVPAASEMTVSFWDMYSPEIQREDSNFNQNIKFQKHFFIALMKIF